MHKKSVFTFGLLLSSLVMLSAIPLLNNNPAMAQEYYDDSYSKYPTKDKKIACQTGQFEGFFVESVEFCKLKIAQGPQGERGLQGEPGVNGTNGLNQILPNNLYIVVGDGANGTFAAIDRATCDAGDVAISGGIQGASFNSFIQRITDRPDFRSMPLPSDFFFDTWIVAIAGNSSIPDNDIFVQAFAQCFDNPPTHIP